MATLQPHVHVLWRKLLPFTNLIVVAGVDHTKFAVVRQLIAQSSKYFEALLGPNFREGAQNEIVLQDIDGLTLRNIIEYIYSEHIALNVGNVEAILAAASSMELVSLEEKCAEYLATTLTPRNWFHVLSLADMYNCRGLKAKAMHFVSVNFQDIAKADIMQLDANDWTELLRFDDIEASEAQIFSYLVDWHNQNIKQRAKHMPELLKLIRLSCLPGSLLQTLKPIFVKYRLSKLVKDRYETIIRKHQPRYASRHAIKMKKLMANTPSTSMIIELDRW